MSSEIEFYWPHKGISERFGFTRQPPHTARDGANVVGMEADTDRIRGGQRPGHSKFLAGLVTAAGDPVLDLSFMVGDDRQITYSEFADTDIETEWQKATPGGGDTVDCAVDLTGRLYVIEGARDNVDVWPTSIESWYVKSPTGTVLTTVSVPLLAGTYLRRIEVDEDLNVYVATGLTNGNPLGLATVTQVNSRIFKYRPLTNGEYVLDWTYAPAMQTTGLGASSTIGDVCYVSAMVAVGVDLYITISDEANGEAELHKYERANDLEIPTTPDVSFGVEYQAFGLAIRDDGHIFTASIDGVHDGTGTSWDGNVQYLTKYEPDGAEVWQRLSTDAAVSGGIGLSCMLDSKNNIYTTGPRQSAATVADEQAYINYWVDEGGSVIKGWKHEVAFSGSFSQTNGFLRTAVDANDNLYVTWPGSVGVDDWEVAAFDNGGVEVFTYPGDGGAIWGDKAFVVLPPTMPDYGDDPPTLSEFLYYGGFTFNRAGTNNIVSSTNATPIVVDVGSATGFSIDEEVQIIAHLLNLTANGRQRIQDKSATTITLENTKGIAVGGATGTVDTLTALKKLKLVDAVPTSGSTRSQKVLAVAGGAIKIANIGAGTWDDPAGGSTEAIPALSAASEYISGATLYRQRFFADSIGYVVYDLATNIVRPFVATEGTIEPRCKLSAAWNGRWVIARSPGDPHGWFMSAAGDPYNWDYFPRSGEVTPTTAAAGVNSDAGRVEDVINGIIPWNDLMLFFMCDHQIWRMTGDPMDGGRIDNVSKTVGMAFGGALARDPNGILYFYSNEGGVYRMSPSGELERISVQWIEKRLRDVDLTSRFAKLVWNYVREGLEIFITARDGAGGVQQEHYFWEQITGAWYPVTFSNVDHEPSSALVLDGDAPGDRVRLIGCEDGFVRKQDAAERDDDGSPIDSFIILGPYSLPGMDRQLRLLRGQITMSNTIPGGVNWKLYSTDRADVLGTPVAQGFVDPGRSPNLYEMRGLGEYFYLELRSNAIGASWALEKGVLSFSVGGRLRATH